MLGSLLGNIDTLLVGFLLGSILGGLLGSMEGSLLGSMLGNLLGFIEGNLLGFMEGNLLGLIEGSLLGSMLGSVLGSMESKCLQFTLHVIGQNTYIFAVIPLCVPSLGHINSFHSMIMSFIPSQFAKSTSLQLIIIKFVKGEYM